MFINSNALFNVLLVFNVVVFLSALAFVYLVLCLLGVVMARRRGGTQRLRWPFYVALGFLALVGAVAGLAVLA